LAPKVEFYGPAEWEKKSGEKAGSMELPAAKLVLGPGQPVVQLVLPLEIKTTEVVIKTVRLLCSKLFGHLFFSTNVPSRPPFSLMPDQSAPIDFDFKEKLYFLRFLGDLDPKLEAYYDQEAIARGFKGPKAREQGQKALFKTLSENKSHQPQAASLIERGFTKVIERLKADDQVFFDQLVGQMDHLLPRGGLILPHEQKNFDFFKETKQWNLFHALEDRLQLATGHLGELVECYHWLDQLAHQEIDLNPDLAHLWKRTIRERGQQLRKRGWVKLHLIEGAHLSQEQKDELARFPLWVWQRGLLDNLPKGSKPEKWIARYLDQYRHSLYAKLYEMGFRLNQEIDKVLASESAVRFKEATRIKALKTSLELLNENLTDLLNCSRIAFRLAGLTNTRGPGKTKILADYSEGWAYFVSFALVHRYYLGAGSANGAKFLKVIEDYTTSQIETSPSYRISGLLLALYRAQGFQLEPQVKLLVKEHKMLDFFAINQSELFLKKKSAPGAIIDHFGELVAKWQAERQDQEIGPDELVGFEK